MDSIKTPFGFSSTADEVLHGVDFDGKRLINNARMMALPSLIRATP